MKCKNIYCERQDDIHPTGCRISGCDPKVCVLNERFKQLQKATSNSEYKQCEHDYDEHNYKAILCRKCGHIELEY